MNLMGVSITKFSISVGHRKAVVRLVRWCDGFSVSGRRSLCEAFRDELAKHLLVKTTTMLGPNLFCHSFSVSSCLHLFPCSPSLSHTVASSHAVSLYLGSGQCTAQVLSQRLWPVASIVNSISSFSAFISSSILIVLCKCRHIHVVLLVLATCRALNPDCQISKLSIPPNGSTSPHLEACASGHLLSYPRHCGPWRLLWLFHPVWRLRFQLRLSSRDPRDSVKRVRSTRFICSWLASITTYFIQLNPPVFYKCLNTTSSDSTSSIFEVDPSSYAHYELFWEIFICTCLSTLRLSQLHLSKSTWKLSTFSLRNRFSNVILDTRSTYRFVIVVSFNTRSAVSSSRFEDAERAVSRVSLISRETESI